MVKFRTATVLVSVSSAPLVMNPTQTTLFASHANLASSLRTAVFVNSALKDLLRMISAHLNAVHALWDLRITQRSAHARRAPRGRAQVLEKSVFRASPERLLCQASLVSRVRWVSSRMGRRACASHAQAELALSWEGCARAASKVRFPAAEGCVSRARPAMNRTVPRLIALSARKELSRRPGILATSACLATSRQAPVLRSACHAQPVQRATTIVRSVFRARLDSARYKAVSAQPAFRVPQLGPEVCASRALRDTETHPLLGSACLVRLDGVRSLVVCAPSAPLARIPLPVADAATVLLDSVPSSVACAQHVLVGLPHSQGVTASTVLRERSRLQEATAQTVRADSAVTVVPPDVPRAALARLLSPEDSVFRGAPQVRRGAMSFSSA
jgi:hypothetical protein